MWRIVRLVVLVFLSFVVSKKLFWTEPQGSITMEMVLMFGLIAVLALSETFSHLSLGSLLVLRKEVGDAKRASERAEERTFRLYEQVMSFTGVLSQVQTSRQNQEVNLINMAPRGVAPVTPGDGREEDEQAEEAVPARPSAHGQEVEEAEKAAPRVGPGYTARPASGVSKRLGREIELKCMEKYMSQHGLAGNELKRDVRFQLPVAGMDPVMEYRVVFDGYVSLPGKELFLQVEIPTPRLDRSFLPLYYALWKILLYRLGRDTEAGLVLLLAKLPDDQSLSPEEALPRGLTERFWPSIESGLLEVEVIDLTADEMREMQEAASARRATNG